MTEFQKLKIEKVSDVWRYKVVNPLGPTLRFVIWVFMDEKMAEIPLLSDFLQTHKIGNITIIIGIEIMQAI